jgi:hypothetical protein
MNTRSSVMQAMKSPGLWSTLRQRLGKSDAVRQVLIQHLAMPEKSLGLLQAALDEVGQQIGLKFELRPVAGEIMLMDASLASGITPQLMQALAEERPVVTVSHLLDASDPLLSASERFERCQQELLRQLQAIAFVRSRSPRWSPSGWALNGGLDDPASEPPGSAQMRYDDEFDSVLNADALLPDVAERGQQDVLRVVRRGLQDPTVAALYASYGAEANLRFDFRSRLVTLDARALQHLRVRREVPQPSQSGKPQIHHSVLELDEVAWALGVAAGAFPLFDEPQDWWHTPLQCVDQGGASSQAAEMSGSLQAYTRLPLHIEMMRVLQGQRCSPSQLRRKVRTGVIDVRRFVQAALMLQLVQWAR